jgi:septal ring factor EnvC (AmiA/AmiB activator)
MDMSERARAGHLILALALGAAACSGSEKRVVDQYFNAVRAGDNQTLASFAAVRFEGKVQSWKITSAGEVSKQPARLPDLAAKYEAAEKAVADNKKELQRYALDHYADIEKARELRKAGKPIPPNLQDANRRDVQAAENDKAMKKAAGEARAAFEAERRVVLLSVSNVTPDDVAKMKGEMSTQAVEVEVTADGQTKPYSMTLRKYDLEPTAGGPRMMSRWMIHSLEAR